MTTVNTGAVLLIVVAAWAAYINSFQVPFVYDDLGNIVTNIGLQTFDLGKLSNYGGIRSLPEVSLALNYRFGKLDVFDYHLVNWLIHVSSGLILFWLSLALARFCYRDGHVYKLNGLTWNSCLVFALFVSLVFAAHPLATEAVTYVIQRTTSMAVLFYLLALASYVQFRTGGSRQWAVLSLIATLLAMHCKQIAFTIPLAIVWLELCFFSLNLKRLWRRLPWLIPWLVMLLYLPWRMGMLGFLLSTGGPLTENIITADITGSVDTATAAASGITPLSRGVYLLTQFGVLLKYLQLLIFPVGQSIDHGYMVHSSLLDMPVIAGMLIVLLLISAIVWFWPRRRIMSFGIGFFFIAMAMESSLIPLLEVVAEYRLYLPLVGFALIMGDVLMWLHTKYRQWLTLQTVAILIILALTVATFQRNDVWQDPISLWQDAVAKAPEKARPRNNLGTLLLKEGEYEEAAEHFKTAIEIDDNYAHAHNNLGTTYGKLGRLDEAAREYQRVLELNPKIITAAINLSIIYVNQKKWDRAAGQLEGVVAEFGGKTSNDPRLVKTYALLGVVYAEQERLTEAAEQFARVLEIEPNNETARTNLELVRALLRQ